MRLFEAWECRASHVFVAIFVEIFGICFLVRGVLCVCDVWCPLDRCAVGYGVFSGCRLWLPSVVLRYYAVFGWGVESCFVCRIVKSLGWC